MSAKYDGAERAVLLEDELGVGLELVLVHAGARVAHRLHDAEAGDARRLADDVDLARALHRAQGVHDRIEILDLEVRRRGLQLRDERLLARVASVPRIALVRGPHPRRIALRLAAEHFGGERREDRAVVLRDLVERGGQRIARPDVGDARLRDRLGTGRQRRPEHALLAPIVLRRQEQRRRLRPAVDDRRPRAARPRRSGRRTGCSAGTASPPAARRCRARSATPSPIFSTTRARLAANSSGGKISDPRKTGWAASVVSVTRRG